MREWNDFYMRNSMQDDGSRPSNRTPYTSPDIICYKQINKPKEFFKANYNYDPNQPVLIGDNNFFYLRGKNMAASNLSRFGFVYHSTASLLMNPTLWKPNRMVTKDNVPYTRILNVDPGQIGVAEDYFLWQPTSYEHTCLVGITAPTTEPPVPDSFSNNYTFVDWVRNRGNVCWRNHTLVNHYPDPNYTSSYNFGNLDKGTVQMFFIVEAADNIPVGTFLAVNCEPLQIHFQQVITTDPYSRKIYTGGTCPGSFSGLVQVSGFLAQGGTWPVGAGLKITAYVSAPTSEPIAVYGVHPLNLGLPEPHLSDNKGGVLVEMGRCSFAFTKI